MSKEYDLMQKVLEEARIVLPTLKWHRDHTAPKEHSARFFVGEDEGWRAVVTDFDISDQGFPPGTRGYDGAVTKLNPPTILHLTRELAQLAFEAALKSEGN